MAHKYYIVLISDPDFFSVEGLFDDLGEAIVAARKNKFKRADIYECFLNSEDGIRWVYYE